MNKVYKTLATEDSTAGFDGDLFNFKEFFKADGL
tara:strand:- start:656 stop:757 length:102 start_codon:yes stop_codon:yes gene_type:complete